MATKLSLEARMTIIELLRRGWSRLAIATSLGVPEGSVRRAAVANWISHFAGWKSTRDLGLRCW